jgi:hypothetical protein
LSTQITQLLRAERRQKNYDAVLVVAGPSTQSAKLLDHLRQALLVDLIEVQIVIYSTDTNPKKEQSAEIAAADFVVVRSEPVTDIEMQWLIELPGHQERVFCSTLNPIDLNASLDTAPSSSQLGYRVWPPTKMFNRQALTTLLQSYAYPAQGFEFDAVFRTERAWYRWQLNTTHLQFEETTYRRQSYLRGCSSSEQNRLFSKLLWQIENLGD